MVNILAESMVNMSATTLVNKFADSLVNEVSLCIQSECGKIRARRNSVFGHLSRNEALPVHRSNGNWNKRDDRKW